MSYSFRTTPPPTYLPPQVEEMREAAKKVGLKGFSRDLVADLCNLAAGGKIVSPSGYRDTVRSRVEETLPARDDRGRWSVPARRDGKPASIATTDRRVAGEGMTEEQMRYHRNVCDFLQTVDLQKFPGNSPLEQAMSLLQLLAASAKHKGKQGPGGEGGEPLPIFVENDKAEGEAAALHDLMDQVDSLSEEEQDMLDPEGG